MRTLATVLAPVLAGAAYLLLIPWDLRNRPEHVRKSVRHEDRR